MPAVLAVIARVFARVSHMNAAYGGALLFALLESKPCGAPPLLF